MTRLEGRNTIIGLEVKELWRCLRETKERRWHEPEWETVEVQFLRSTLESW